MSAGMAETSPLLVGLCVLFTATAKRKKPLRRCASSCLPWHCRQDPLKATLRITDAEGRTKIGDRGVRLLRQPGRSGDRGPPRQRGVHPVRGWLRDRSRRGREGVGSAALPAGGEDRADPSDPGKSRLFCPDLGATFGVVRSVAFSRSADSAGSGDAQRRRVSCASQAVNTAHTARRAAAKSRPSTRS